MDMSFMPLINTWFSGLLASCRIALLGAFITAPALAGDFADLKMGDPKPAATLDFRDALGKEHTLATDKGSSVTVVHFWATWCVPCVGELPEVEAMAKKYANRGLKVIFISLDGTMPKVESFVEEHKLDFTPFLDNKNASFKAAAIPGLPATVFINSKGEEVGRVEGPLDWKKAQTIAFIETQLNADAAAKLKP